MSNDTDKGKFFFAIVLFFALTLISTVLLETFFNKGDATRAIEAIKNTPSQVDSTLTFEKYIWTMVRNFNEVNDQKFSLPRWTGVVTSTFYGTVKVQCELGSPNGILVFAWEVNRVRSSAKSMNPQTKTLIDYFHKGIFPKEVSQLKGDI